jgi:ubiquitin-large subunit ribosomal protein L40e
MQIMVTDEVWPFIEDRFRVIQLIAQPPPPEVAPTDAVQVKTLTGKTTWVDGLDFHTHTIWDIKSAIKAKEWIPQDQQKLIFAGKLLEDQYTLEHYDITAGCVLHLVLRLRGGMDWFGFLRKLKEMRPLPRARRLDPSQFLRENFICFHYQQRKILTSWDADFMVSSFPSEPQIDHCANQNTLKNAAARLSRQTLAASFKSLLITKSTFTLSY